MNRALLCALLVSAACRKDAAATPPGCEARSSTSLRAARAPDVDGRLEDEVWPTAPVTGPLTGARGEQAVAHTEARSRWTDSALYLGLYASDDDQNARDAMLVQVDDVRITVSPTGEVDCRRGEGPCTPAPKALVDADGTVDVPGDDDEEWTAELEVPWATLGLNARPASLRFNVVREDRPRGAKRDVLMSWSRCGTLTLND